MYLGYIVVLLFALASMLSYLEKYMGKYKLPVYLFLGIVLIVLAGTREVGIDPDSINYEDAYHNYYSLRKSGDVDFSFLWLSSLFNNITSDVHIIFLFYATVAIILKFISFRKLSEFWFLPVVVYLSYYYELHEMTQIRTGVLSGLFLLSIVHLAEGRRLTAFLLMVVLGGFFHISSLMLLPLLFLSNKEISPKYRLFWAAVIPVAYVFHFFFSAIIMSVDLPYIGDKLAVYQAAEERGIANVSVNIISPLHLFTTFLFYYLLFFYDTIKTENKYFPLLIKIYAIGVACYTAFAFLPVLAERTSYQFRVVTIILYANIIYTIKPKWFGMLIVILVAFVYLNYGLPYISMDLFWESSK